MLATESLLTETVSITCPRSVLPPVRAIVVELVPRTSILRVSAVPVKAVPSKSTVVVAAANESLTRPGIF